MVKILVVDDDPFIDELYRVALEAGGHEVHHASDGDSALRVLAELRPQLVLLELRLPHRDGLEVLRELHAAAERCELPVVIVLTNEPRSRAAAARNLGAYAILGKAETSPVQLLRIVTAWERGGVGLGSRQPTPASVQRHPSINLASGRGSTEAVAYQTAPESSR